MNREKQPTADQAQSHKPAAGGPQATKAGGEKAGGGSQAAWNEYVRDLDQGEDATPGDEGGEAHAAQKGEKKDTKEKPGKDAHADQKGEKRKKPKEKPAKDAFLDLSKVITAGGIASVLKVLANEPGDVGLMEFKISAEGKIGSGAVNGMVHGWAELSLSYSMNDENFCVLAVDAAGAMGAGIDLAGFVQITGEVGYGKDFLNQWFSTANDAGAWILGELHRLNDVAGGRLLKFGGEPAPKGEHAEGEGEKGGEKGGGGAGAPGAAAFSVHDQKVFAGGKAEGGVGDVKGDIGGRATHMDRTYRDQEHHELKSTEEHRELEAGLSVKLGKFNLQGRYHSDWSNTVGSPIYYRNGIFKEHDVTIGVSIQKLLESHAKGAAEHIPPKSVQDLCVNTFAALEKVAGKFRWLKELNQGLFTQIVDEMYKSAKPGKELFADFLFNIIFNWNDYGEASGKMNLMYFRVKVQPMRRIGGGAKTAAGGAEAELTNAKTEVIYEKIGSETVSFIQRQFIYETEDRPWAAFKAKNKEELNKLVQNCATPGFPYYVPEVEKAFKSGDGKNYAAGLAALEKHWKAQDQQVKKVRPDAIAVGNEVESGMSIFTFRSATMKKHMAKVMDITLRWAKDPKMLKFFLGQLPSFGVQMDRLETLAKKTDYLATWNSLKARAEGSA